MHLLQRVSIDHISPNLMINNPLTKIPHKHILYYMIYRLSSFMICLCSLCWHPYLY